MTHAPPGRRGLTGDEAHYRLLDMRLYIGGGGLLGRASNFADQDDGLRSGILIEQLERVDMGGADDGVAADADRRGLPNPALGELIDSFVSEGSGAGDNAHAALLVDTAGHDADLGFPGRNNARAVGPDQAGF